MRKNLIIFSFQLLTITLFGQDFAVSNIPEELKKDAYAVIRNEQITVDIHSIDKIIRTKEYIVTVYDQSGDPFAEPSEFYDPNTKITSLEVIYYDKDGKEIKKFKSKDFLDQSYITGGQMYTDNRIKYLNYTPAQYPYTLYFKSIINHSNTTIGRWVPINEYNVAIQNSSFTINNLADLKIQSNELNLSDYGIASQNHDQPMIRYEIKNQKAVEKEELTPSLKRIFPYVEFSPVDFVIDGVKGSFTNWNELGKWYKGLLTGTDDLTPAQKSFFQNLVKDARDDKEKIRILYDYLQSKTRYIGVQLGIGGLKPFPASYVESKSYGDCKALTNYMQAMLNAVGIPSYYTVVYAGQRIDFDTDFASIGQGNHVILYVPSEDIWLENTSQNTAFNFLGAFTDDRNALLITPEGGKIIRTQAFPAEINKEVITGKGEILPDGKLNAEFTITDSGMQYDWAYQINFEGTKEQKKALNDFFFNLPNLNIKNYSFDNNRKEAIFIKKIELESFQFAKIFGNNMTVNILPAGLVTTNLKKDNNRKFPFEVRFGFTDEMDFEIKIPQGYKLDGIFEPVTYDSEFGSYQLTVDVLDGNVLKVKRKYLLKDGEYPKEKFNEYVEFRRKISSFDNTKILLEKL